MERNIIVLNNGTTFDVISGSSFWDSENNRLEFKGTLRQDVTEDDKMFVVPITSIAYAQYND